MLGILSGPSPRKRSSKIIPKRIESFLDSDGLVFSQTIKSLLVERLWTRCAQPWKARWNMKRTSGTWSCYNTDLRLSTRTARRLERFLEKQENLLIFLQETRTSTLVDYGDPKGYSAMARLVGTPCAVAVKFVLNGTISEKGILAPMYPKINDPLIKALKEDYGIECKEQTIV